MVDFFSHKLEKLLFRMTDKHFRGCSFQSIVSKLSWQTQWHKLKAWYKGANHLNSLVTNRQKFFQAYKFEIQVFFQFWRFERKHPHIWRLNALYLSSLQVMSSHYFVFIFSGRPWSQVHYYQQVVYNYLNITGTDMMNISRNSLTGYYFDILQVFHLPYHHS